MKNHPAALSLEQIMRICPPGGEDYLLVKFVRVNGEYRFCDNCNSHRSLIDPDEKVESAGLINLTPRYWRHQGTRSITTNSSSSFEDIKPYFEEVFKRPGKSRFD